MTAGTFSTYLIPTLANTVHTLVVGLLNHVVILFLTSWEIHTFSLMAVLIYIHTSNVYKFDSENMLFASNLEVLYLWTRKLLCAMSCGLNSEDIHFGRLDNISHCELSFVIP